MSHTHGLSRNRPLAFPHLVVRLFAACYIRRSIAFVDETGDAPVKGALTLAYNLPFINGELTEGCRRALIELVKQECGRTGRRMCVVFALHDCVYVEPDGSAEAYPDPPSMKIKLPRGDVEVSFDEAAEVKGNE